MSPEEQADACADFSDHEGAEIVASVDELDSVSGGSVEREGLQYALWLCDDGQADGIIVAKLDRFARTVLGGLKVLSDLEERGHLLLSAREGVIVGDERAASTDKLTRTLFLMLAQWHRDTLAESWEATRERHIADGVANNEPYGYVRDDSRRLVPDPVEADFVRQMFQLRADGKGWATIAKTMNATGAMPRRTERFTHARISAIVANRVYLGKLKSGEYVNKKAHEPLVSAALFNMTRCGIPVEYFDLWTALISGLVAANGTRSLRIGAEVETSLLAGIAHCASCGQKLRLERRGHLRYYRCRKHFGWGSCPHPPSVPADALDEDVDDWFQQKFFGFGAEAAYDDDALTLAQGADWVANLRQVAEIDEKVRDLSHATTAEIRVRCDDADIGRVVVFLASDASSYITAHTFIADGGAGMFRRAGSRTPSLRGPCQTQELAHLDRRLANRSGIETIARWAEGRRSTWSANVAHCSCAAVGTPWSCSQMM
jgi:DNA invertase Pin-like site-specific DNA recombinase